MTSAYSTSQVERYLDYINFPSHLRAAPRDLDFLTTLHVHQIAKCPYENLALHYSPSHSISLDPQVLFDKFTQNGRGGYCMETAIFFRNILRALGYRAYSAGVRMRQRNSDGVPGGEYSGWVHCTNIVTFADGSKYSVDVGFGGDGPTKPLPLVHGHVQQNLGLQEVRLVYERLPHASYPETSPKFWTYQYRNGVDREWNSFYAFAEFEFFDQDFGVMNYFTSTSLAGSFQTRQVLVVKFQMGQVDEERQRIVGKVMLVDGKVKRNMGRKTEVVMECKTEKERLEALKNFFQIELTDEEIAGIRGHRTELAVSS